ncbi:unnamed protein product [Caenorhabditis angaria]|uniref:Protein kinase domain-containing protein n=1 Tax=Caenorhabditis angaria TaxID=860376 RepID=A0A9P1IEK5_9PELO|nr:unnamed protein product [Caenorhabditis angaria]
MSTTHAGYILPNTVNFNPNPNNSRHRNRSWLRHKDSGSTSSSSSGSGQKQQNQHQHQNPHQRVPLAGVVQPSAVVPIGGAIGGAADMANSRKMSDDTSSIGSFENMSRPIYQGRDTDRFFGGGEFEFDEEEDDFDGGHQHHHHQDRDFGYDLEMDDDDDDIENEPISELVPLGGGTRRVPRTPRRKSTSKCGFYDFYKLTDEHLGSGAYGSVTTCTQLSTGLEYAVKIVDKQGETHSRQRIMREVNIFKTCKNHPNIVQLVDWFEDDESFYLVMEKMRGGPLLQHILSRGYFTEELEKVTKDVATALKFMHDRGIAHRDVKPENVLCTDPEIVSPVKLCDLDLASQRHPHKQEKLPQVASEPDLASPVGSAEFMAPEVVDAFVGDALKYDKKCDTWSLGVILYIMLAGYAPFQGECDDENCGWSDGSPCDECQQVLFHRIQAGKYEFPEDEWEMISDEAKDLVSNLLKRDPVARFNADQILSHPWIQQSAPQTILQTPSNLIYRKDSARDVQQMCEHFNVMSRYVAARLSARMEDLNLTEEEAAAHGELQHFGGGSGAATDARGFLCVSTTPQTPLSIPSQATRIAAAGGDFTPPISRASPTSPPMCLIDSAEKRNDSGCYSMFSPRGSDSSPTSDSTTVHQATPTNRDSIQLFGSGIATGPITVKDTVVASQIHQLEAEV